MNNPTPNALRQWLADREGWRRLGTRPDPIVGQADVYDYGGEVGAFTLLEPDAMIERVANAEGVDEGDVRGDLREYLEDGDE